MKIATQQSDTDDSESSSITDVAETVVIKVIDSYYTIDDSTALSEPIIHLFGRGRSDSQANQSSLSDSSKKKSEDRDQQHYHIEVEGFYPYFGVDMDALDPSTMSDLSNDHRVRSIEDSDDGMDDESLVKVVTAKPYHIKQLREAVGEEHTFEADVQFIDRFLIDKDIVQCIEVPSDADERRIHHSEITAVDDEIDVRPRICTFDIEVEQTSDGPSVVSEKGTELASNPITAITAHDNYTDEYYVWVLAHSEWSNDDYEVVNDFDTNDDVGFSEWFESERELLKDFCGFVAEVNFDIISGWNSNSFDVPYIVNRCLKEKDIVQILDWSPTRDVETMNGEGRWINSDLKGIMVFDMLMGYEKVNYRELESYSLANVADSVLDIGKLDVGDIDDVWANDPQKFVEYNQRDVEAVVKINEEAMGGGQKIL